MCVYRVRVRFLNGASTYARIVAGSPAEAATLAESVYGGEAAGVAGPLI